MHRITLVHVAFLTFSYQTSLHCPMDALRHLLPSLALAVSAVSLRSEQAGGEGAGKTPHSRPDIGTRASRIRKILFQMHWRAEEEAI